MFLGETFCGTAVECQKSSIYYTEIRFWHDCNIPLINNHNVVAINVDTTSIKCVNNFFEQFFLSDEYNLNEFCAFSFRKLIFLCFYRVDEWLL